MAGEVAAREANIIDIDSSVTAALLGDLLRDAGHLSTAVDALLAPVAARRDDLRRDMLRDGVILPIADSTAGPVSVAAVDGGSVREHLYGAEMLVAVAAAAEGMTSTAPSPLGHAHWAAVRPYHADNDRLLSAAMASLELTVLHTLAHDLRIVDGAFRTPLLSLSAAITGTTDPDSQVAAAELLTPHVLAAAADLCDPDPEEGVTVALPKADGAHVYADMLRASYGVGLPGGDRMLAAQVLGPGEMLYPRVAQEYTSLYVSDSDRLPPAVRRAAGDLSTAVTPLLRAAQQRRVLITYVKPVTADTVLKVEYVSADPLPASADLRCTAVAHGRRIARLLSDETPGPHLQEPFAQYAVDLAAKSVSIGAQALNQAMLAQLPARSADYIAYLTRSYRTTA